MSVRTTAKAIQKERDPSPSPSPGVEFGVELKTDTIQNAPASASPSTATQRNFQGTEKAMTTPREKGMRHSSATQANVAMATV